MATPVPPLARIGAIAAFVGAPVLFVATYLHPMRADPNDAVAAFAEYAADRIWIASHLGQFAGIVLLAIALIGVAAAIAGERAAAWARIGVAGTGASVALTAALQAVDGIALKRMVDRWAQATGEAQARAFEAAFAVRQIEIGLASLTSLLFGLTIVAFAIALLCDRGARFPKWIGWLGIVGGAGTVAAGLAQAHTGFSAMAMTIGMPASIVLLAWAIVVGLFLRRPDGE
jgi:hypothetical protein